MGKGGTGGVGAIACVLSKLARKSPEVVRDLCASPLMDFPMKNALLMAISIVSFSIEASAQFYTAIDLGVLGGGTVTSARAINSAGTIVGYYIPDGGGLRAFSYSGGAMTDLGFSGYAMAISDSGQVVGTYRPDGVPSIFSYSSGVLSNLGPSNHDGPAMDVNISGTIVGSRGPLGAFTYSGGTYTNLSLGGDSSEAFAINSSGTVVGSSARSGSGGFYVFSYSGGVISDLNLSGRAYDINDLGTIVGISFPSGNAFSYAGGIMTSLGTLGGSQAEAYGINNSGIIVGRSYLSGGSDYHAFVYAGGEMLDLNLITGGLMTTLDQAHDINDDGQIVASGANGRSYLLLPTSTPPSAVPEPSTYAAIFGVCALGLAAYKHRRVA